MCACWGWFKKKIGRNTKIWLKWLRMQAAAGCAHCLWCREGENRLRLALVWWAFFLLYCIGEGALLERPMDRPVIICSWFSLFFFSCLRKLVEDEGSLFFGCVTQQQQQKGRRWYSITEKKKEGNVGLPPPHWVRWDARWCTAVPRCTWFIGDCTSGVSFFFLFLLDAERFTQSVPPTFRFFRCVTCHHHRGCVFVRCYSLYWEGVDFFFFLSHHFFFFLKFFFVDDDIHLKSIDKNAHWCVVFF